MQQTEKPKDSTCLSFAWDFVFFGENKSTTQREFEFLEKTVQVNRKKRRRSLAQYEYCILKAAEKISLDGGQNDLLRPLCEPFKPAIIKIIDEQLSAYETSSQANSEIFETIDSAEVLQNTAYECSLCLAQICNFYWRCKCCNEGAILICIKCTNPSNIQKKMEEAHKKENKSFQGKRFYLYPNVECLGKNSNFLLSDSSFNCRHAAPSKLREIKNYIEHQP